MLEELQTAPWLRRTIIALLIGGLLLLSYVVLSPFLVPVIWALILAYVTWPLYVKLRRLMRSQQTLSALTMALLLAIAFVVPLTWLAMLLRHEVAGAYDVLTAYFAGHPHVPPSLQSIPWLGDWLQDFLERVGRDPQALRVELGSWADQSLGEIRTVIGGVGRNLAKVFFSLLTVFFVYRNGEQLTAQVREVLQRILGDRIRDYLAAIGDTTSAVVYGIVLAAVAQGILAGVGYWFAGLKAPVLLGATTTIAALIPFGAPFVWASAGIWLLITDHTGAGIGLLLWGALAVSWVDNLIRPLIISNATRVPFLLVMFGVLGGIAAFGLVGLFVGPVILAVLMAVWREWLGIPHPHVQVPVRTKQSDPV
jgi:predicted PurR-regulated permease PerM